MMGVEGADSRVITADIAAALDQIEGQLITLIREGAHGGRSLAETIADLSGLLPAIGAQFDRLQSLLAARDLTFGTKVQLDELRARLLWLYRKARLEELFFVKLQLERAFRDELYQRVLETYDEFTDLERREGSLRDLSDHDLAAELQRGVIPERDQGDRVSAEREEEEARASEPPFAK
jgi:hypothetical protein